MQKQQVNSKKAVKGNSANSNKTAKKKALTASAVSTINAEGELKNVAVSEIDFSPLNYRKFYVEAALHDFAAEIVVHGIISPLTVRKAPSGRYELVAGERRLRAAAIANLAEVPVVVKVLTDDEVTEIQLAENLQRENPHPMHEAQAIGQMKQVHKSIDEIAARLGKSKPFVYSRIKFLDLIEPIQEMFVADAINIQEAFDIAALSAESQQELFVQCFEGWKAEEDFAIGNLRYQLSKFKYDLNKAPFDTKDKKLVPEMGACTNCPFNSATLKTLFPELAKEAICTKKDCYQSKCNNHITKIYATAFKEQQPQAIIYAWGFTDAMQKIVDTVTGMGDLPRYSKNEVVVIHAPVMPDKKDYTNEGYSFGEAEDDEEQEAYDNEEPEFDETGYNAAFYEYGADLEEYNNLVETGSLLKGLLVSETTALPVMFSPDKAVYNNAPKETVTAKQVQEAIREGSVTPELLQGEIDRINQREKRAKELDAEKIQLNVHTAFMERMSDLDHVASLTDADLIAARLLVYQSLDWSGRNQVNKVLFAETAKDEEGNELSFYDVLRNLTEQQYSYLIRMAIGYKSEAKTPNNTTGKMLVKVAEAAGIDLDAIRNEQQEKVDSRTEKLAARTDELKLKIEGLKVEETAEA
jgi:ParB family chromosome partitioning protein